MKIANLELSNYLDWWFWENLLPMEGMSTLWDTSLHIRPFVFWDCEHLIYSVLVQYFRHPSQQQQSILPSFHILPARCWASLTLHSSLPYFFLFPPLFLCDFLYQQWYCLISVTYKQQNSTLPLFLRRPSQWYAVGILKTDKQKIMSFTCFGVSANLSLCLLQCFVYAVLSLFASSLTNVVLTLWSPGAPPPLSSTDTCAADGTNGLAII